MLVSVRPGRLSRGVQAEGLGIIEGPRIQKDAIFLKRYTGWVQVLS